MNLKFAFSKIKVKAQISQMKFRTSAVVLYGKHPYINCSNSHGYFYDSVFHPGFDHYCQQSKGALTLLLILTYSITRLELNCTMTLQELVQVAKA